MTSDFYSVTTQTQPLKKGFSSEDINEIDPMLESVQTLANESGQLMSEFRERPVVSNSQIHDLGEESYKLTTPIMITIEDYFYEDTIIAHFPEIEVFGEGVTESEAINNLKSSILDLFDELNDTPREELGTLPLSWLNVLNKIIQRNF